MSFRFKTPCDIIESVRCVLESDRGVESFVLYFDNDWVIGVWRGDPLMIQQGVVVFEIVDLVDLEVCFG